MRGIKRLDHISLKFHLLFIIFVLNVSIVKEHKGILKVSGKKYWIPDLIIHGWLIEEQILCCFYRIFSLTN